MPIPEPKPGESEKEFISRCMSDEIMRGEYPDEQQRAAICHQQFETTVISKRLYKKWRGG